MVFEYSIANVFAYVTNMENYIDWFPGVVVIESINELPHGVVGKKYRELLSFPEGEVKLVIEVKESICNERFYTEGDLNPLLPAMLMEFESLSDNRTQLKLSYYSRNPDFELKDEVIQVIKQDLTKRITVAGQNLSARF